MSRRTLWELSVVVDEPAAEEATAELLQAHFGNASSSYTNVETGETVVSLYLDTKPDWSKSSQGRLTRALSATETLSPGKPARVRLRKLQPRDWAEAWKRHFKPLRVGGKLLIRPSWSQCQPRRGEIPIVLDPGMSFGTGQHPTTGFCLAELVRARNSSERQSFLDIGTGSGILAIAAAKLGYKPVRAFDLDEVAVRIARQNARFNQVGRSIGFECRDVATLSETSRRYDVACANLLADLILKHRDRLVSVVVPGGKLVLAGILSSEFEEVRSHYEEAGVRLLRTRGEKEWRSGCFVK